MKRLSYAASSGLVLLASPAAAQEADQAGGIDAAINAALTPVADAVYNVVFFAVPIAGTELPLIVAWLAVAAVFFTVGLRFLNLRSWGHAYELVRGHWTPPHCPGEVTHFQALATALSGTVGLGNIAGVGVAIGLGGPGATFWMILMGLCGMSTKFVECTLGVKYRVEHPDGSVSGGPMHYLSRGLAARGMGGFGRLLGGAYAVIMLGAAAGAGNLFQVNQAYQQVVTVTGGPESFFATRGWLFGLIAAVLVGIVIVGGIKRIAGVTDKLVPFMALFYIAAGLVVIVANITQVPAAVAAIIGGAFSPEGVAGGFIGVLIQGVRRATFSNEAGIGSAAIAHSAVKTREPITEGFVALYEPFVDTVLVCTMTALVIVISGAYLDGAGSTAEGIGLTSAAFASAVSWFPIVLAVAVVLFAFSTILAYAYYLVKAGEYLFGDGPAPRLALRLGYLVFTVIGATMTLDAVVDFSDAMLFALSIMNITGLYIMFGEVRRDLASYQGRIASGEIRKVKEAERRAMPPPST